jgi:hypothetical protein
MMLYRIALQAEFRHRSSIDSANPTSMHDWQAVSLGLPAQAAACIFTIYGVLEKIYCHYWSWGHTSGIIGPASFIDTAQRRL